MAETTGISWARSTWSPWIGCTEVSPGCDNCYARELDKRHKFGGGVHWGAGVPRYRTKNWTKPLSWNRSAEKAGVRRTVFPSLCDPFDNEVPREWQQDFLDLIAETPNLTWLLLTKRIGNVSKIMRANIGEGYMVNVWLGASVVNQEEADRDIPKLLNTPAALHFLSLEPQLAPIDLSRFQPFCLADQTFRGARGVLSGRIGWVICGGESSQGGAKARPFDVTWARSTIAQCGAAGVQVFVKQLGSTTSGWCFGNADATGPEFIVDCQSYEASEQYDPCPDGVCGCRNDRAGADPHEWPEDLRVQEFPR